MKEGKRCSDNHSTIRVALRKPATIAYFLLVMQIYTLAIVTCLQLIVSSLESQPIHAATAADDSLENNEFQSHVVALLNHCMSADNDDVTLIAQSLQAVQNTEWIDVQHPHSGQTALMACTLKGKPNTVDALLKAGADASIPEKDGYTPPHGAAFQGRVAVLQVLVRHGIVVSGNDVVHADGYLPFHRACWGREQRHTEFVEYMLAQGLAHADVPSQSGMVCSDMTQNAATQKVLVQYRAASGSAKRGNEL